FPRDQYGRIPADVLEAVGLFLAPQVSLAIMDDDVAERLTGVPICEPSDLVTAARQMRMRLKVDALVLRGVERVTGPYDVQVLSEGHDEHRHQVVPCLSHSPYGLDAVYAAAAAAQLAHGMSRPNAVQAAQQYAAEVHRCTATAPGAIPLADPFAFLGGGVVFAG
ncbi:MAG: bifunctional hydroxymethylpyrimidine kinase/phosphomethylpyrimidine kinase, partial [Bacteroidota bacterium]